MRRGQLGSAAAKILLFQQKLNRTNEGEGELSRAPVAAAETMGELATTSAAVGELRAKRLTRPLRPRGDEAMTWRADLWPVGHAPDPPSLAETLNQEFLAHRAPDDPTTGIMAEFDADSEPGSVLCRVGGIGRPGLA